MKFSCATTPTQLVSLCFFGFFTISTLPARAEEDPPLFRNINEIRSEITFPEMTADERQIIANQAQMVIRDLWVNHIYKAGSRNVHGPALIAKVARQARTMTDSELQREIIGVFQEIADLHTAYTLPHPYKCYMSMLPIGFGRIRDSDGTDRLVVRGTRTSVAEIYANTGYGEQIAAVKKGDFVISYDGMDYAKTLRTLGKIGAGANTPAQEVRALDLMDFRWHGNQFLPDNDQVAMVLQRNDGTRYSVNMPWSVYSDDTCLNPTNETPESDSYSAVKTPKRPPVKSLFSTDPYGIERQKALRIAAPETTAFAGLTINETPEPSIKFGRLHNENGLFGYVRIENFVPTKLNEQQVIELMQSILIGLGDTQGVVLDLRGNPGGNGVLAGAMVQLFTPKTVAPITLRMRPTELNRRIVDLPIWDSDTNGMREAMHEALANRAAMTKDFPFSGLAEINGSGQAYFGPVAVLVNPSCYSSCDVFSAMMQDNRAATIWGENGWQTGAGGGNVIKYDVFSKWFEVSKVDNPFLPLPFGIDMTVGWRQVIRTGRNSGWQIEDRGVQADRVVYQTLADLLENDKNLFTPITKKLSVDAANRPASGFHFTRVGQVDSVRGQNLTISGDLFRTDTVAMLVNGQVVNSQEVAVDAMTQTNLVVNTKKLPVGTHRLDLFGMRKGDITWHLVRPLRVFPGYYDLPEADSLTVNFDNGSSEPFGIYTNSSVATSGWQVLDGRLVTNTTPEYDNEVSSMAILFVDLSQKSTATLRFVSQNKTEKDYDFFAVLALTEGDEPTLLVPPASGDLGIQTHEIDLTPLVGKKAEIQFVFVSDGGVTDAGVSLDNITIE